MNKFVVVYADGPASPLTDPLTLADVADVDGPVSVQLGFTVHAPSWLADNSIDCRTFMAGYGLASAVRNGRVLVEPLRLSQIPSFLTARPPEVAVVTGVARGCGWAFTTSVGWGDMAAVKARNVIVEVDPDGVDFGGPDIVGNIVGTVERPRLSVDSVVSRSADETDLRIGALVASLVPVDATLQFGPGGVGEGIARALTRPVRIWSGLFTDAMADLALRGLVIDKPVAAYTWGGEPIDRLGRAGGIDLRPVSVTHDAYRLGAISRFVACNTALQVGLDGAINVEQVGGRVITSVGGHTDFCEGAAQSVGGISVIAVRSMTAKGASTIVVTPEVVSTPGNLVSVVVTEHGIADLRGMTVDERAQAIVAVADPSVRAQLRTGYFSLRHPA